LLLLLLSNFNHDIAFALFLLPDLAWDRMWLRIVRTQRHIFCCTEGILGRSFAL